MKFSSLSEAILYYTSARQAAPEYSPYGSFAAEDKQVPLNTSYISPNAPNVITYGKSIWGLGKITNISKPIL